MYGVKGIHSRTCCRGMGSYFRFCNEYFVDIISQPPKSLLKHKFRNQLNFPLKVYKLLDPVYLCIKMYGIKGQLCKSSFTELASFFSGIL